MPPFGPLSPDQLVAYLGRMSVEGPYAGGKHEDMARDTLRVRIPNPHRGDIGRDLLARLLRQAGVSREECETL